MFASILPIKSVQLPGRWSLASRRSRGAQFILKLVKPEQTVEEQHIQTGTHVLAKTMRLSCGADGLTLL